MTTVPAITPSFKSPPPRRLTDADILERLGCVYEYVTWASDMGMIDFAYVADIALILAELRLRATEAVA